MIHLIKLVPGSDFELISFFNDDNLPPYAILSHTWTDGQEVTYNELVAGTGKDKAGYAKIDFCSRRAAADGLDYFWVDTCCIDKSTSNELSTAINSMFRWYQRARKCYVYLSDVFVPAEVTDAEAFRITWAEAFRRSRWFTRGWTLQELLAPPIVEFFSKEGKKIGSKISLEREIHKITEIPISVLRGQDLAEFSVDERMSWAAKRKTTLKEDKVYCLLGIFGVFLSLIYGEGEAYATLRLREEIQRRHESPTLTDQQNVPVRPLISAELGPVQTLKGHSRGIMAVAFSPDGKWIASASFDKTVRLWDSRTWTLVRTLEAHSEEVAAVAFLPEGKRLVSASWDGIVMVWDTQTGVVVQLFRTHAKMASPIAFSLDGERVASASDAKVQLMNTIPGKLVQTYEGHSNYVTALAFSRKSRWLASAFIDGRVQLWDNCNSKVVWTIEGHVLAVSSVAFSPDGMRLASASLDTTVRLSDARDGKLVRTLNGNLKRVFSMAFSPDNKWLVSGYIDGTVQLWDAQTGVLVRTLKGHSCIRGLAFSPDSKRLASASMDSTVQIWDIDN